MRPPLVDSRQPEEDSLDISDLDPWELAIVITVAVLLVLVLMVTAANVTGVLEGCLNRQPPSLRNKSSKEHRRSERRR